MSVILLNAAVAAAAIIILLLLWGGVHLLAHKRLGYRQIGCRGPVIDGEGNEICCHTGERCKDACHEPHPPHE